MESKDAVRPKAYELGVSPNDASRETSSATVDDFGSNGLDAQHMHRMGKDQEMTRVFRQLSLLSFTCIVMGTWEWMLIASTQVLVAGGRAGMFWTYIWSFAGYGFLIASLAEMAAMAPTAGGQYHWVSEFAPRSYQRFLSYVAGWLSTLCWQAGQASGVFIAGYLIQSLVIVRDPEYPAPVWQGFLMVIAVVIICIVMNIWAEHLLPAIQNATMVLHVAGFIATVSVFWALGPKVDARTALLDFTDEGGWSTMGLALMIGQISAVVALGASDAAAHMSEEVRDAGLSVPRAMFWTYWINGAMGFIVTVSYVFAIADIDDAINDPSGFPVIYALRYAAGSTGAVVLVTVQLVLLMVGNVSFQASTARQTFAFARDGGLPFSRWIGKIDTKHHLPVNSIWLTGVISVLLSAINLGSTSAFNAIISLTTVAQMATYGISITCVLYRRITAPHLLPKSQWTLGKYGVLVNGVAVAYSWFTFFWMFWPNATPVDNSTMNWSVVMFGGTIVIAMAYFFMRARKRYAGPVTVTEGFRSEIREVS